MLSVLCQKFLGKPFTGNVTEKKVLAIKVMTAIIDRYNMVAAEKNMPRSRYPTYYDLRSVSFDSIKRNVEMVYNMLVEINNIPIMKTARDVSWSNITIAAKTRIAWKDRNELWYYIQDGNDICVYANTEKIIERLNGGTSLELGYDDMPYELLVDNNLNTYPVTSYMLMGDDTYGLFGVRGSVIDSDWNTNVIEKLTTLTLQNWTNKNVTNMSWMFYNSTALTTLILRSFDTSKVTDMTAMFDGCTALETLDIRGFDTSKVTSMRWMIRDCTSLETLDIRGVDTSKVTDMYGMLRGCTALITLILGINFTVPTGYGEAEDTETDLAPSNECSITMNENVYNAFKLYDLATYTFSPNTWNANNGEVQTITVTPP